MYIAGVERRTRVVWGSLLLVNSMLSSPYMLQAVRRGATASCRGLKTEQ